MAQDVQVAVIGGGIVGASVLYWLTRLGWTDALLVERRQLTSGSTWHAAGNTTYFGPYPAMTRLFAGSIVTYQAAEAESGQSIGFHQTGSLRLAASAREAELFESYRARYAQLGIPYDVISPDRVAELHPLVEVSGIHGAAHTPTDGHVDPTGATHALAKAAKAKGAGIKLQSPVHEIVEDGGIWRLETETGPIRAKHVVVATSFWAREMLAPLGLDLPLYATEHHEMITEPLPELAARDGAVPAIRDSWVSCNVRQERDGLLVGIYETEPEFWATDGIPPEFVEELLPPNIDRLLPHLERLTKRMPRFAEFGLKAINNGPFCMTPDGLPLVGPAPGLEGLWLAAGFNVGIGTGGGAGEFLGRWMVDGRPAFALSAVHADRFGQGMPRDQALQAIRGVYARGYKLPEDR